MGSFEDPLKEDHSDSKSEDDKDKKDKRFYKVNPRGNVEFIENPYKVPEEDLNATK